MPHHPIDTSEAIRPLTQRTSGQQPTVTDPAHRIDHGDLEVARQRMMLQPIVAEHQARTGSDEQLGTARAIDACDDGDAGEVHG